MREVYWICLLYKLTHLIIDALIYLMHKAIVIFIKKKMFAFVLS